MMFTLQITDLNLAQNAISKKQYLKSLYFDNENITI